MVDNQLLDVVGVKVDETDNNTHVCKYGTHSQLADVANKGKGDQDGKEDGDPNKLVQLGSSQTSDNKCKLLCKEDTVTAEVKKRNGVFSRLCLVSISKIANYNVNSLQRKTHQQNPN